MKLGHKLRELREAAGLSRYKLCLAISKNRGTYRALEEDNAVLDINTLIKLCSIYQITPNDVLEYKTDYTPKEDDQPWQ